ncbi:MAG: ligase-associated DNA damage response exonuclease [Pseudomonadota bacterium]
MRAEDLLRPTPEGLYCPVGDFHIDPVKPVARALITHGHADHARPGHDAVWATKETLDIMAIRYGGDFAKERRAERSGEIEGVRVAFHPAGHVLGSAQIAVEHQGLRIVAAGDYKRGHDATCAPFEPVACDVFITEATFGLPIFRHPDPADEVARLIASLARFPGRAHLVGVYALGKAQRMISLLRAGGWDRPIFVHGALRRLCDYYEAQGVALGPLADATAAKGEEARFAGEVVLAPPSAFGAVWARRFPDPLFCFASGWMQVRARAKQRRTELPLIISDHADWDGLTRTIEEIDPGEVWVTHGREEALVRWCEITGRRGRPLNLVGYEDEAE